MTVARQEAAATSVDIRPVESRRELTRFIKLPFRLHADHELWVPPLIFDRRRFLDPRKNPFFQHAEARYFLAYRDGRVVGRISAHVDQRMQEFMGSAWGLFGFFECENDPAAAEALLATAEAWVRERGCEKLIGPMDFTTNHECGLLVDGYDLPPQILEPWHPPYYRELVEGYPGLDKAMDLFKWKLEISDREKVLPIIFELADKLEPEHGITIRHMRKRDWHAELGRFLSVYNAAWEKNWGFVPLTDDEIEHYAKDLKPALDENWAMVAEKDGEPVGAALTLPDYNQVLKRMNGRVLPFGWAKALLARKKIDSVRVFALGVRPEYQHTGVAAGLYREHFEMAAVTPQTWGETGWILETNVAMNKAMEAMNGSLVKRHRLYEKQLT